MINQENNSNETSLWECLHDGDLESVSSDLLARTLTFLIDVPFHWEFHRLPPTSRFRLVLEGVRILEALRFEPWPGQKEIPQSTPWAEAQRQRKREYEMGRLESTDWSGFVSQVESGAGYEISHGTLTKRNESTIILMLEVYSSSTTHYRELLLQCENVTFSIGQQRQLTLEEFLAFGNAYWEAFAMRKQ